MKFLYLIGSCSLVLFKRSLDVYVYSTYSVDCVYVHVWVSVYVYLATFKPGVCQPLAGAHLVS